MNLKTQIKQEIEKLLKQSELLKHDSLLETLETPPNPEMGDIATNIAFSLASKLGKSPVKISEEIVEAIKVQKDSVIEKIETKGGYINFFLNYEKVGEELLQTILKENEKYGSSDYGKGRKVLVEYSAPNPNKPQHIGHTRNNLIGMAINNIYGFAGFETHPVNWINDRGIHICKSLWGYLQFGKKGGSKEIGDWKKLLDEWYGNQDEWLTPKDLNKKPDYFVMDYYVKAANLMEENKEYDEQNRELLQEWENENPKVRELWKKMNSWAYEGWNDTYNRQGCIFEKYYYESDIYKRGKEIVFENMNNGVFFKSDEETIVANLEKYGLPGLVVVRSDGTSLYPTADLVLTEEKVKDYSNAKLIWVVGGGQKLYFQQLFQICDLIGIVKKEKCYHLGYGMISLPEGKMSSREGKVVLADNLMNEIHSLVEKEIEKKNPELDEKKKYEIAEKIALGAIKYGMLKIDAFKDFVFNINDAVNFEGNTGPYLQYAHVRADKILQKSGEFKETFQPKELKSEEKILVKKLLEFPEVVEKAVKEYKPNLVANYGYDLAETFNTFYHSCPVLQAKDEQTKNFRLTLVKSFKITLKNCLSLLGIETPEVM
ncbi:MAG: arginine--tRNA ligase [Candidatus Aenigmarchaeota archaeon]|nr:arginine--tRNA ligase [Candidatus Aenigmarchaeota archaeon]